MVSAGHSFPDLRPTDERVGLTQRLDEERWAIVAQLGDLTDAEARSKALPATQLTVGGVVKHLAHAEDRWFQHKFLGHDLGEPWTSATRGDDHDWPFRSAGGDSVAGSMALYEAACERSRLAERQTESLDAVAALPSFDRGPVNLRWLLIHMIDETAHHSGHLDLLRDALGRPPVRQS